MEDTKTINIVLEDNDTPKNYFEECRKKLERQKYLLMLQKKYKNKEILEKDMNEKDKTDLENLYVKQNAELKRKIRSLEYKNSH